MGKTKSRAIFPPFGRHPLPERCGTELSWSIHCYGLDLTHLEYLLEYVQDVDC